MKRLITVLLFVIVVMVSCQKENNNNNNNIIIPTPTQTPSPMGAVGTTFAITPVQDVSNVTIAITESVNNVSTVHMTGTVDDLALRAILKVDENGNFDTERKFKFTMEGITDYVFNNTSRPFTLVDYDWQVGDSTYVSYDNDNVIDSIVVRKVVARSNNDDYYWGGMYIKTMTIEERHGGFTITYRANHKFGIVYLGVQFASNIRETQLESSVYNF